MEQWLVLSTRSKKVPGVSPLWVHPGRVKQVNLEKKQNLLGRGNRRPAGRSALIRLTAAVHSSQVVRSCVRDGVDVDVLCQSLNYERVCRHESVAL